MSKRSKPKLDRSGELIAQLRATAKAFAEKHSARSLADQADIEPASLCRFLAGARGLTLETADRLAGALGLRLSKR